MGRGGHTARPGRWKAPGRAPTSSCWERPGARDFSQTPCPPAPVSREEEGSSFGGRESESGGPGSGGGRLSQDPGHPTPTPGVRPPGATRDSRWRTLPCSSPPRPLAPSPLAPGSPTPPPKDSRLRDPLSPGGPRPHFCLVRGAGLGGRGGRGRGGAAPGAGDWTEPPAPGCADPVLSAVCRRRNGDLV